MDKSKLQLMESAPIYTAIMKLAVPTVLSMVVQVFYNLTDTFFIGQLNDPVQVAGVTVALPITMMQMALAGIFGNGGGSYVSRLLGAKRLDEARATVSTSLATSLGISILVAIVGTLLAPQLISLSGASTASYKYALHYVQILLICSPIPMLNFALSQLLRSEGAAKAAMNGMIVGTVVNIILDPLFIFVFKMGVSGAAVATVLGNAVGILMYMLHYTKGASPVRPAIRLISLRRDIYLEIFKIGIPSSVSQIMMSIGSSFAYRLASAYGDNAVAAMGVSMRIFSIPTFVFLGIAIGIQALIGYNYGARLYHRMRETIFKALFINLGLSALGIFFFALFPSLLIKIFISDKEVVELGTMILRSYIWAIPFAASGMIFMMTLQATGKSFPSLIVALSRQGIVFIPALIILNSLFGFKGLVFALPVADAITVAISSSFVAALLAKTKHH